CLFWYALVVMQTFILPVTLKSNRVALATLLRVPVRGFFYEGAQLLFQVIWDYNECRSTIIILILNLEDGTAFSMTKAY
ncbi:hypothetical protein, partial [Clostridium thermarum]|uniref:hypothetical protein n=1 Tax=Clostridium thermarum TaxID=1716543 RepID=UPI001A9BC3EC